MRSITLIAVVFFIGIISFPNDSPAQTKSTAEDLESLIKHISELEFRISLTNFVEKRLIRYGNENIPKEKFLISLMRLVNREITSRIKNPTKIREKYFEDLRIQIDELRVLRERLKTSNISELDEFAQELEARMRISLKSGYLDYRKKNVFDDALQLLYVAEEMIKLDQANKPEQIKRSLSNSKSRLLSAFEEVGSIDDVTLDVVPNIFNLFEEWKITENIRYDARLIDVKIARSHLLKSSSLEQILRMFNEQLRFGYSAFNISNYDLSDRILEDLIKTYASVGIKDFEDVYFYWAESNFALSRFLQSKEIFEKFLQIYPNSVYGSKVYGRLMQIAYTLDEGDEVLNYYSRYKNIASSTEEDYYDNNFVAALTLYNRTDLNNAVEILSSFPQNNPYYYLAQFLIGTIYATGQNFETAKEILQKLSLNKDTPFDIYCRTLYKLALIEYENNSYFSSIQYLTQIPEKFSRYDKVLNALAWSSFKFEHLQITEQQRPDFTQAKLYAKRLLNEYYASDFRMECESLLAFIYQLEIKPDIAIGLYKDVYDSKIKKSNIDQYLVEKSSLDSLLSEANDLKELALRQNNIPGYVKASDIAVELEDKIMNMELMESGAMGSAVTMELDKILAQLAELNLLKEQAKQDGNIPALMKIDSNVIRLTSVIEMFPESYLSSAAAYNWFDAYPIARNKSENEFQNAKNLSLRESILSEISAIDSKLITLRQQTEAAKVRVNFRDVALYEQKINHLLHLRKEFDSLYTETFNLPTAKPYAEFDKWGDFGAFGIIDVNFGQRERLRGKMTYVSETYNMVVDVLNERREVIDDKLKRIEAEIRLMTMKARLEERVRLRAERERAFRETYFDKRTSEFDQEQ